tara:strand:- start:167 stop:379 length:213 start_codon:yes stop_codon:yes gene_type:complete
MVKKRNNKKTTQDDWIKELISISKDVVLGYENYLLDKINYNDLANIITKLRKVLEKNGKFDTLDKDDKEN